MLERDIGPLGFKSVPGFALVAGLLPMFHERAIAHFDANPAIQASTTPKS
jgi:hypothetical protein